MNLNVTWVGKICASSMCTPGGHHITSHSISREEIHISVSSGSYNHRVCCVSFEFSCDQVTCYNSTCFSIDHHQIHHLMSCIRLNFSAVDLSVHRTIGSEQKLLTCLSFRIKSSRHQYSTKGTVIEQTTIFTSKRNTLRYALINNTSGNLGQSVGVGFARTIVATFGSIVKQTVI